MTGKTHQNSANPNSANPLSTERFDPAWQPQTLLVRGGTDRSPYGETSEAIFMTSGFRYESAEQAERRFKNEEPGFVYGRFGNPTVAMFERRMALLEGAEAARAVASGMAAVNASIMCQVRAGDHVAASQAIFGSCRYIIEDILPRFGVSVSIIDGTDMNEWKRVIGPKTKIAFIESPANPTLELIDIRALAALCQPHGTSLVVDNVFATPMLQKPLELGADVVVYSATKHIDGQGRCLGGVVLGSEKFVTESLTPYLRHTGPALSPFNAWVMLKGLETLELRVARHVANAEKVAAFLASDPRVSRVTFPGLPSHPQAALAKSQMKGPGSLICFEVKDGGKAGSFNFLNRLKLIDISNNLGDAKSLITHPATTTHQRLPAEERARLGISDSLLRLSVGLEAPEDIINDIGQALSI